MTDISRRDFAVLSASALATILIGNKAMGRLGNPIVRYRFEHPDDPLGDWTAGTGKLRTFKMMQRHHAGYNLVYLELV